MGSGYYYILSTSLPSTQLSIRSKADSIYTSVYSFINCWLHSAIRVGIHKGMKLFYILLSILSLSLIQLSQLASQQSSQALGLFYKAKLSQLYSARSFLRLVHKGTRSGFHSFWVSFQSSIDHTFQPSISQGRTRFWPWPSWWS